MANGQRISLCSRLLRMFIMPLLLGLLTACTVNVTFRGLKPVYPGYPDSYTWQVGKPYDRLVMEVDSLQPALKWEAFPRPQNLSSDTGTRGFISNVTYDLRILRTPSDIVYERKGLSTPYHTVETPLQPSTTYFWTVRARFDLDGKPKVTGWSEMSVVVNDIANARPHSLLYSFKTPGEAPLRKDQSPPSYFTNSPDPPAQGK